jgi:uncharacterized coiled-coil protein SlyX
MYSRKAQQQILDRLGKLEDKYHVQENQVKNLLELFKEYHTELDRRRDQYAALLRKSGMVGVFILGMGVPFI